MRRTSLLQFCHIPDHRTLSLIAFIDGARLDEFTCDSGTSLFMKFKVPDELSDDDRKKCRKLSHMHQFLPIIAVAVKYGKSSSDQRIELTTPEQDYMYQLLKQLAEMSRRDQPTHIKSCLSNLLFASDVFFNLYALMGDYPSMTRFANCRSGHCPFCVYAFICWNHCHVQISQRWRQ